MSRAAVRRRPEIVVLRPEITIIATDVVDPLAFDLGDLKCVIAGGTAADE